MKKLIPLLLIFLLCGCAAQPSEETAATIPTESLPEIGTSGYFCLTEELHEPTGSETVSCTVFRHKIYDPDRDPLLTLTVTVTGSYQTAENTASILNLSVTQTDETADGLSTSQHLSGDTATVILYRNQLSVCHFQYRISPDGTISLL